MERFVIIGAGAAGISAAKVLRDFKPQAVITVISIDEKVHSRCMLHKYLGHERTAEGINFVSADFFEKNDIIHIPCEIGYDGLLAVWLIYVILGLCLDLSNIVRKNHSLLEELLDLLVDPIYVLSNIC